MFETLQKQGILIEKMGQKENISVGEEKCKSQEKKKKKKKLNHLLNFWLKKKMLQSWLE